MQVEEAQEQVHVEEVEIQDEQVEEVQGKVQVQVQVEEVQEQGQVQVQVEEVQEQGQVQEAQVGEVEGK